MKPESGSSLSAVALIVAGGAGTIAACGGAPFPPGMVFDEVQHAARCGAGAQFDPAAAILTFAAAVNDGRGEVTDAQVAAVRSAGVTDQEIAETIGHVALNVLTNFFNKAVDVDIDFPVVSA